jgi:ABC-type glycerol-3-phosphate transport system permease component
VATVADAGPRPRPAATVPGWRPNRVLGGAGTYALLGFFVVVFLVPLFWVLFSAFKTSPELLRNPFGLPEVWRWENFAEAWEVGRVGRYLGNSVLYTAAIVVGVVALSTFAGYALAMLPLPGRDWVLVLFLLGLMVPFQSFMIPLYYLLRDMRLLETYWAFILPGIAFRLPFGIFLMRGFFRGLPGDLADAARVDGANEWQVFRQVMLPLAGPGLAAQVIFQFVWAWREFLMPLVFVQTEALRPVSTGIMFFFGRFTAQRDLIAAGVVIAMIPMVAIYLLLQRRFIEGITAGALKS